jgi:hypothetical protein
MKLQHNLGDVGVGGRMILKWTVKCFELIKVTQIPGSNGRFLKKKIKTSKFLTAVSKLKKPIILT